MKNIRSIVDVTIDFSQESASEPRQWTCLLGENGCGKSTLLRAAALVLAGGDALPEIIGEVDRWIRNGADTGQIDAVIETQDGKQRVVSLELERGMQLSDLLKHNAGNLAALDAALRYSHRTYFVAGYGVSRRLSSGQKSFDQSELFRHPRSQAIATLFSSDASLRSLSSWAMDLEYRRGRAGSRMIAEAIENLLPDVEFQGIDRKRRKLMFQTKDGPVPLEELSDGYQNVAAWCGDLLYRITETFEDQKSPLNARGLLLLDEVDLHLHPKWQRQLVQTLRERLPNFQMIATTHSALTAQQCGDGELYIVQREENIPTLQHYEGAPNVLRIEQLLVSPLFGLDTGVSVRVEEVRKREAAGKKLSAADVELLGSVPRPRVDAATEHEKMDLLRTVNRALATRQPTGGKQAKSRATYPTMPAPMRPAAGEVIQRALKPSPRALKKVPRTLKKK